MSEDVEYSKLTCDVCRSKTSHVKTIEGEWSCELYGSIYGETDEDRYEREKLFRSRYRK